MRFPEHRVGPIPWIPLVSGLVCLLPLWVLAACIACKGAGPFSCQVLDTALATYAAILVSFLGGTRWGSFVVAPGNCDAGMQFVVSLLPSLAAWVLLVLPEPWRLLSLGLLSLGLGPIDRLLDVQGFAAPWLCRLRTLLSSGAGMALLAGAMAYHEVV